MSLLKKLGSIVEDSRAQYEREKEAALPMFTCMEQIGKPAEHTMENMLALGDNGDFMRYLLQEKELLGKIKLIYIDPPFFSGANYTAEIRISTDKLKLPQMKQKAYHDTWENGMEEYLSMLTCRLLAMRDLLAEDGGIWVHLDWHIVHYVKVIMDEIFGEKNFINEVIWNYKSGGVSKYHFARKHDTLLYYGKSKDYYFEPQKEKSYNRGYKPYRFKGVKEYRDELGWYTMVNKKDVWQIDMVGRTAAERTGYATQKPELLLKQILESCTREGDLCADFFSGSGTLAAAAETMGRRWICCDMGTLAVAGSKRRLAERKADFSCYLPSEEAGSFGGNGKVSVDVALQESALSDTTMRLELKGYALPTMDHLSVGEQQRLTLKKIVKKDPLALVDFWTVDYHFDGKMYRPTGFFYRKKAGLTTCSETPIKQPMTIGIKVYDVFGGSGFFVTQLGQ